MEDPFNELLKSLQTLFHTVTVRNGKYTIKPVQTLMDATAQYNPRLKSTFYRLLKALCDCIPYFEKRRSNLNDVIHCLDQLAKKQGIAYIDWNIVLEKHNKSPRFRFSTHPPNEQSFMAWISKKTGKPFNQLNHFEKTQTLVDFRNHIGFSQKLCTHLKKHPDFLFELSIESEKNFLKIANTRLNLYLTDKQLAESILHHLSKFIHNNEQTIHAVDELVKKLNEILSNGRSVGTLLRNKEAKIILEQSIFFQLYQSETDKNKDTTSSETSHIEKESLMDTQLKK